MPAALFVQVMILASAIAAPIQLHPRACQEGLYNCLNGKTFQQCVSGGTWSAIMPVAPGTVCRPGIAANPWLLGDTSDETESVAVPQVTVTNPSTQQSPTTDNVAKSPVPATIANEKPPLLSDPKDSSNGETKFPPMKDWPSFEQMLQGNPLGHCDPSWNVADNSPEETQQVIDAIKENSKDIDPRFILSIVMQESSGCVRVKTTNNGVRNPGLMQDSNGPHTCNENGTILNPCPREQISGMILDGVSGGDNNYSKALEAAYANGLDDSLAYAVAARNYNSGIVDFKNLNNGLGSDNHYVVRVMSRLAKS